LTKIRKTNKRYLNVGCGKNTHPSFINLDFWWHPGVDLCWDVTKGIPLARNSITGIFTEHCLEHLTFSECVTLMKEFYKILEPYGVVRIVVPDGELYLDLYQKAKRGLSVSFPYIDEVGARDFDEDSKYGFTPMMAVNRIFREYGHLFIYDQMTLENLLKNTGFREIQRVQFIKGRKKELLIDSELRKPQSLYIEGSAYK
jgi:predicted SAM-dependent methyltransferase